MWEDIKQFGRFLSRDVAEVLTFIWWMFLLMLVVFGNFLLILYFMHLFGLIIGYIMAIVLIVFMGSLAHFIMIKRRIKQLQEQLEQMKSNKIS
jgi:hypothetical protein